MNEIIEGGEQRAAPPALHDKMGSGEIKKNKRTTSQGGEMCHRATRVEKGRLLENNDRERRGCWQRRESQ